MTKLTERGSSHIVALVGVLVIAAVAFVGYRALNASTPATPAVNSVAAVPATGAPAQIKNTADLKKTDNALQNTSVDGSVNPNDLNSDISSL